VCVAASVYLVYVLEIFKFKVCARSTCAGPTRRDAAEIDDQVRKDVETGEFEKIGAMNAGPAHSDHDTVMTGG